MPAQVLELKPVFSVASALKQVRSFKMPVWVAALLVIMGGVYGYLSGRQNPAHHYVAYVGYPLVLDTTTGKACYSTAPRPSDNAPAKYGDYNGTAAESTSSTGPAIPMCGK